MTPTENGINCLVILVCLPIAILIGYFFSFEKSVISTVSIITIYSIISLKWSLRRNFWFWTVIFLFILIHFLVIVFANIRIPSGPALPYVLPSVFVDGLLMYGVISTVERSFSSNQADSVGKSEQSGVE